MILADARGGAIDLPLFFHVAGAMALVASLVVGLYAIKIARERGDQPAAEFAFNVLLRATLPAYIVMRVMGQIVLSKEHLEDNPPSWAGAGFGISDLGLLLLVIGLVLTGLMARRTRRGQSVARALPLTAAGGVAGVLIVAYLVAIWAMTTKPT